MVTNVEANRFEKWSCAGHLAAKRLVEPAAKAVTSTKEALWPSYARRQRCAAEDGEYQNWSRLEKMQWNGLLCHVICGAGDFLKQSHRDKVVKLSLL